MERMELLDPKREGRGSELAVSDCLSFARELAMSLALSPRCLATSCLYFHTVVVGALAVQDGCLLASACLFLAAKTYEQPRHLHDFVRHAYRLLMKVKTSINPNIQVPPLSESMRLSFSEQILTFEFEVLQALGFCTHFELPFDYIELFQHPDFSTDTLLQLKRFAKCYANDSFRVNVGLRKSPADIANACLLLAAQYLKLPLSLTVDEETYKYIKEIYDR